MPEHNSNPETAPSMPQQHSVEALEIAIGKQVRASRKRLNLTVAALAKQAQLSTGMLSKIENGQTSPSLATLTSLANALQVPVRFIGIGESAEDMQPFVAEDFVDALLASGEQG